MAETVSEIEAAPDAYPAVPVGLSDAALALDASMLWQRIEAYTAHRFSERRVTWLIEGEGHWAFPLTPAVLVSAERWVGEAWEAAAIPPGPYGYCLNDAGPHRIVADVGIDGDLPAAVQEAFRRLAEYLASEGSEEILTPRPGASSHSAKIMDYIDLSVDRAPTWIARAIHYSGAADLLRPYRRA